ncbi:hypothetical protein GCM10009863_35020 [Streptomyces axinellae]|uniref:Secreted protein n=1 Tax=Streptomyces axinellae TaxID=552788 RepID=A0ABN3Q5W6_9ACTN
MPSRKLPVAPHRPAMRGRPALHAHRSAAGLTAVFVLLLTVLFLGGPYPAAEELGCPEGGAGVTATAAAPCHERAVVTAPRGHHHPGHGPSHVCPAASAGHRLCHAPLPAVDFPPVSELPPRPAAAAGWPPAKVGQRPPATRRQILRC